MTFFKWSRTAASNSGADSTINYAEGQSPGSLNDSARAAMAASAKFRDDISGALVTGGTSAAYTLTSYQVFDSLVSMDGKMIAFTPHATNTAGSPNVTLNVDGLGAKTIRADPASELSAGVLVSGTPYLATYSNASGIFYLHGVYGNLYNIPIGGSLDYWGATSPNSSLVLMYGQAISRTTYATLFGILGTAYGTGDGTTTFNIPDLRGRTIFGKGDMGGIDAGRITSSYFGGASPTILGGAGGQTSQTLATANLPPYTPSGTIGGITGQFVKQFRTDLPSTGGTTGVLDVIQNGAGTVVPIVMTQGTFSGVAQGGTSSAFSIMPPGIIANKLLRII